MSSSRIGSEAASTAQRWYQTKRLPLYVVVGGTFVGAFTYLRSRTSHPQVETKSINRQDPLAEERDSAIPQGQAKANSAGRQLSRDMGMHDGQDSDGIFPNSKMAKKVGEVMPSLQPEINSKADLEKARGN
ncbi:hypothetical protein WJX72_002449 [[Myrmecia] bisecta]|uniref:Uncharacterized protein n=1 Tax=[Myrmecia] bisecta TaxID=41462 RepID=A0AAW1Q657_9CHLO